MAVNFQMISGFCRDMISAPFWDFTQRRKRFLKMGPVGCPETSARNHHSALRRTQKNGDISFKLQWGVLDYWNINFQKAP
jgi:hypothetical protein